MLSLRRIGNIEGGVVMPSDYVFTVKLEAGVAQTITMPADATFVLFNSDCDFWVKFGTNPVATVPSSNILDGTSSILNPVARIISANKLSMVSATGGLVTLEFYKE